MPVRLTLRHFRPPQVADLPMREEAARAGGRAPEVSTRGVSLSDVKAQIPDECAVNPTPPAEFPANCSTSAGPVPVIPPLGLDVYYEGLTPGR
jgi:hypothetical protein